MFITKKSLPRRTVLRGLGATLALPFLESMVPAMSARAATPAPLRFGAVYLPNGCPIDYWIPKGDGGALNILLARIRRVNRHVNLFPECHELLDRCRTLQVARDQCREMTLFL